LNECMIDNSYDFGIAASNSSIMAKNCLISNCGKNIGLIKGGSYNFTNCTVVTISNPYIQHTNPVLQVTNFDATGPQAMTAIFRNCIFWGENGSVDTEVLVVKSVNTGALTYVVDFSYNLWKVQNPPAGITVNQSNSNANPLFDSIDVSRRYYNFRLKSGPPPSPGIDKGTNAGIFIDLDGNPRPVGAGFDIGCFEKQ
jgi:hypothetical protein